VVTAWNYEYSITMGGKTGIIDMRCPTSQYDMNIYFDNKPIGRTNGKLLTLVSETDVWDCHNKMQYSIQTGSITQTLLNQNKIYVNLQVQVDGNPVYYIEKTVNKFAPDEVNLFDMNMQKVANFKKTYSSFFTQKLQWYKW
jgi:hypothetical protein